MLNTYDLPRLTLQSGQSYIQVPELHPAHWELSQLGILPDCVQVGSGNARRPKVYLYRAEIWIQAMTQQCEK